jgi:ParB family chromosome partitioning protein
VVVRAVAPAGAMEMALVENLQREDLNPVEEAEAFARLMADFAYTQESLATRVGKDRSTVANALRLLKLPATVRALMLDGRLQMGHARALLGLEAADAIERVARMIVTRDLSVRQVEALVRRERDGGSKKPTPAAGRTSATTRDLEKRLERSLATKVRVVQAAPDRGHVEIHYASLDQLDGLLDRLLR